MNEYKFRVLVDSDTGKTCFRDISISSISTFDKLHHAIIKAFNFKGDQMASFYMSNEDWDKGEEIGLMDLTGENEDFQQMSDTLIWDKISQPKQKMVYVYDFLNMWCFYIDLLEINELDGKKEYPFLEFEQGKAPREESKSALFLGDLNSVYDEEGDEYGMDDEFGTFENIDDYDF